MAFIRDWIQNILKDLLIFVLICIGLLIFVWIFYPDALSLVFMMGEGTVQIVDQLRFWPIVILVVILYAIPRRVRRRS